MIKLASAILLVSCAMAQDQSGRLQFDWDKLAAKAVEKTNVVLEGPMLQMASQFLSGGKKDEADVKKLVEGLKGVYVRSFEFDKEGQYTAADVAGIRSQLKSPEWSQVVDVQERNETSAVYLKSDGKLFQGLVVVSAEPKELTVVQIIGLLDPSALNALGGSFGIPSMNFSPKSRGPAPVKKK